MKRMFKLPKRIGRGGDDSDTASPPPPPSVPTPALQDGTPEELARRNIKLFCDCGGPQNQNQADEITFLPIIVEMAECSPTAAKEALATLRKQLDVKQTNKAYRQYNALMLLRILTDNPGRTFTRNIDKSFVSTIKELWKNGRDQSVRQLLGETLEYFENNKLDDPGLTPIREWYAKEKEAMQRRYDGGSLRIMPHGARPFAGAPPAVNRSANQLPPVQELAARISEAQMSAKLLMQILQSTPEEEILQNQLIREFADRCSSASRSMQQFIECQSPPPDESTMVTLFETNEQLAAALSRHQLAIYSAKQKHQSQTSLPSGEQSHSANGSPAPQVRSEDPFRDTYASTSAIPPVPLPRHPSSQDTQTQAQNPQYNSPPSGQYGTAASEYNNAAGQVPYAPPVHPSQQSSTQQYGDYNPDNYTVSPQDTPSQVPHGYQPYRY